MDANVEPQDLPEPGTPEFIAGLASDEFTEAWQHLRLLSDYDHNAAEDLARRWRETLASMVSGG